MRSQTKSYHTEHFSVYVLPPVLHIRCSTQRAQRDLHRNQRCSGHKNAEKGESTQFQNHHEKLQVPFEFYADFEAVTEKVSGCTPNNSDSYTEANQKHKDCSSAYKVVCCYDDQYSKLVQSCRGANAVNKFLHKMLEEVKYCRSIINHKFNKDLFMTHDEKESFQKSTNCLTYLWKGVLER